MKLCMPTINEQGLAARLSPHFGSAPYYTVVESETGDAAVLVNGQAQHEHGHCDPTRGLQGQGIDAVVCRGLGRRALMVLDQLGIQVLMTEAWTVADALAAFRTGRLASFTLAAACQGGHHDPGHAHEHHHGHGYGHV